MSLLTLIQNAADRLGIPRPTAVIGTYDTQIRQLLGLAQQEGKELARMGPWQELVTESTFTTTATETQSSVIPTDCDWILEGTVWNRTQSRRVVGPLTPQKWQSLKAGLTPSIWDAFRIRGSDWIMSPTPQAGDTIAFEYVSTKWATDAAGTTPLSEWMADDDVGLISEELMTLGVVWRFLKAKGLAYDEAFRTYQMQINQAMARNGGMSILDLSADTSGSGVFDPFVQEGNWTV